MNNPRPWHANLLVVVPGILVALQNARIGGPFFPFAATAAIAFLLVIVRRLFGRSNAIFRISLITICGSLVWETYQLLLVLYGGHLAITLMKSVLGIALLICLVWLAKFGQPNDRVFALIVVILIIISSFAGFLPLQLVQLAGLRLSTWLLRVIPFLIVGIYIFRKYGGSTALLFIVVCEMFWLQLYLAPEGIEAEIRATSDLTTQSALWLYSLIPALVFLVVSPLIVLTSHRIKRESLWLLALSLVAVCITSYLRTNLLVPPYRTYILPAQFMWIEFTILLWAPMLIASLLYRNPKGNPAQALA